MQCSQRPRTHASKQAQGNHKEGTWTDSPLSISKVARAGKEEMSGTSLASGGSIKLSNSNSGSGGAAVGEGGGGLLCVVVVVD